MAQALYTLYIKVAKRCLNRWDLYEEDFDKKSQVEQIVEKFK